MKAKLCILALVALFVCSHVRAQSPGGDEHEWRIAMAFLKERGLNPQELQQGIAMETIVTFTDNKLKVYAAVVAKDYEKYIDNPVLAWGTGDELWKLSGRFQQYSDNNLLIWYDNLLRSCKENGKNITSAVRIHGKNEQSGVKPLLGGIRYGQEDPYNRKFPLQEKGGKLTACVVGCGPVALAQVLAHYHSAEPPTGSSYVRTGTGSILKVNMSEQPFSWNGGSESLGNLMLCAAASLKATVSLDGTSSGLGNFKPALLNHWHYSPRCRYMQKASDEDMLKAIYSELDQRRPVIIADTTHMFVCDGYYKDYLHINLGWDGIGNGYYRAMVSGPGEDSLLPFNELLVGIEPLEEADRKSLDITLGHSGQLAQMISEADRAKVTRLRVTGYLNGDDIALIRQMAGADGGPGSGSLMELDLSGAAIVKGGCYVTRDAGNMVVSGTTYVNKQKVKYSYNMAALRPGQWKEMQELGLANKPSRVIKAAGGGKYTVSWYATDSTIGPYMFDGCDNLCRVVLPRNIKEVKENAFFGCISLVKVEGLPKDTSPKALNNTGLK